MTGIATFPERGNRTEAMLAVALRATALCDSRHRSVSANRTPEICQSTNRLAGIGPRSQPDLRSAVGDPARARPGICRRTGWRYFHAVMEAAGILGSVPDRVLITAVECEVRP